MTVPQIDRRIIFLLLTAAVTLPLVLKVRFKEIATPMVQRVYDKVESLPPGSKVLMALDYEPGSAPELAPMTNAFVRHMAQRKVKIYFISTWPLGPNMINDAIKAVLAPSDEDEVRAALGERAGELGADAGARSGDDGGGADVVAGHDGSSCGVRCSQ